MALTISRRSIVAYKKASLDSRREELKKEELNLDRIENLVEII